jgi:hypothetical protein
LKYYENKQFVILIQILSIIFIAISKLEIFFQGMLLVGYILLFWQKKWHKHLLIMALMLMSLALATNYYTPSNL